MRSAEAGRNVRRDPGSGGTIRVSPVDLSVVVLVGAGARTLEAATGMGLGARIVAIGQDSGISVNGVDVGDGVAVEFMVSLTDAGVKQWVVVPQALGSVDLSTAPVTVTGARDVPEEALANLLTALAGLGIITDSTTST
jgi:hypothetical protein